MNIRLLRKYRKKYKLVYLPEKNRFKVILRKEVYIFNKLSNIIRFLFSANELSVTDYNFIINRTNEKHKRHMIRYSEKLSIVIKSRIHG